MMKFTLPCDVVEPRFNVYQNWPLYRPLYINILVIQNCVQWYVSGQNLIYLHFKVLYIHINLIFYIRN